MILVSESVCGIVLRIFGMVGSSRYGTSRLNIESHHGMLHRGIGRENHLFCFGIIAVFCFAVRLSKFVTVCYVVV